MKAVVLLNMGGPNNLDEVEIFLKNMFNDKNIITTKSNLLRKIIAFSITFSRKEKAKNNYRQIGGKSPLIKITDKLVEKLQIRNKNIFITYAMRYTPPFSNTVIKKLIKKNINEILLIPLYPHYSTTTTKSSIEDFIENAEKLNFKPKIRFIKRFYKEKLYNDIIIKQIKNTLNNNNAQNYDLIFSAHSLPQKIIKAGDTYQKEIEEHASILNKLLKKENINFNKTHLAYQSKLGPVKWIGPSLEEILKKIKNKKVIIYPISFTLDNSETLQELQIEYKAIAKKYHFQDYKVCECPNDNTPFINFIQNRYIDNQP